MRRIRRLKPYYKVSCNGGTDNKGCRLSWVTDDARQARSAAVQHAYEYDHEAIVVNLNDGLVVDGR